MDPTLYKAAVEGNSGDGVFLHHQLQGDEEKGYQQTQKGNTVLHVAALYGHSSFVQQVLTISPKLLFHQNKKKETAFHVAAKEGHIEVIKVLLTSAGSEGIMRMRDEDGDTALHKAVRKQHCSAVSMLVQQDPDFQFPPNNAGETPLYLAAESNSPVALGMILEHCNTLSYSGPCQRNPMHAAIIFQRSECFELLWDRNKSLCKEADECGWNALHYAIKLGLKKQVSDMLSWNKTLAYIPAGNIEWTSTFHIAAAEGSIPMLKELLKHCPDCWELLNSHGQNALHVAILNNVKRVVKFLLDSPDYFNLIDEADNDGNTPLHLLAATGNYHYDDLIKHPRNIARKQAFNKQNQTPFDIAMSTNNLRPAPIQGVLLKYWLKGRKLKIKPRDTKTAMTKDGMKTKEEDERLIHDLMNVAQTHLVVAALIVTVTFAAGFTLPGGLDSNPGPNQGKATLTRKVAFKAFVITDAIAFVCSTGAVFSYFTMAMKALLTKKRQAVLLLYLLATCLQLLAMAAAVVAFVTGMCAVLEHTMAIAVTVIGCFSFFIYFSMLYMVFNWKRFRYALIKSFTL